MNGNNNTPDIIKLYFCFLMDEKMKETNLFSSLVLILFFVVSCTSATKESVTYHSGILLENMDSTVLPGDDFHEYVNGTWIKNTEIPADKSNLSVGLILHERSQEDVKEIIEEAAEKENKVGSDEQKIGDLYASYMNLDKRNELGLEPILPEFDKIDQLSSYNDLAQYFGYAEKRGFTKPMSLFVSVDKKDPTIYSLYTFQDGLGLPEREYYLSDDGKFPELRKAYVIHVAAMLELCGFENAQKSAQKIMDLETKLASFQMKKEDTRDWSIMFNKYSTDSLDELMPDFDWKAYLEEVGVPDLKDIVVTQVDYTRKLNGILKQTDIETLKIYLKWGVINSSASNLSEELDNKNFEFYGKTLLGKEEQLPLWRRAVSSVNDNLGEVVGKVYVKKHFPPEAKKRMMELVMNLVKAYDVSIRELDWMSEETKEQALEKLSKFTPKIGYPDKWKDYSAVTIQADDLYGNLQSAALATHERELAKLQGPIDKAEWHMTPQTVNAYYNPSLNEIVFPAAILQPPFFDLEADDAVNYGGIGGVIGHEIGHGFDDKGSTFDGDGMMRDWWKEADLTEFKKRTNALVDQYNEFHVFDDLTVNGTFTLGENIGDLGGLTIALKAYDLSLNGKEGPEMDGYSAIQRVFIGWAQLWRKKGREEYLRMQVSTDPHSPAKFRVNGVVRNIPEFYEAFDVTPENKLYLSPDERVKIW